MYSFSGWNAATYIIGEMNMPQRNLPRALLAGTLIVLVLYVALNAVFLYTTPIERAGRSARRRQHRRQRTSSATSAAGSSARMICIGLISSISAMMWIGPRVMMTMGEDIPALRVFSQQIGAAARRPMPSCFSSRSPT